MLKDTVGEYDLMVELSNASIGLTFGQLLLGAALEVKKQMERLLSPKFERVSVLSSAGNTPDAKCLELAKVNIYGRGAYGLMDSDGIPNVMSKTLYDRLSLTPDESNRRITTATCVKSHVHGILKDLTISFDHVVEPIDFLVIEGSPYEMRTGRSTIPKLNGVVQKDGEQVVIPLLYKYVGDYRALDGILIYSADFTFDSEAAEQVSVSTEST